MSKRPPSRKPHKRGGGQSVSPQSGRRPPTPKATSRFASRPGILPAVKDKLGSGLLDEIDSIGDTLRGKSMTFTGWKAQKGDSKHIWIAEVTYKGSWRYDQLHEAIKAIKGSTDIEKERLVYGAFHFEERDSRNQVTANGWASFGPLTPWQNLEALMASQTSPDDPQSYARRYKASVVTAIQLSFASNMVVPDFVPQAESGPLNPINRIGSDRILAGPDFELEESPQETIGIGRVTAVEAPREVTKTKSPVTVKSAKKAKKVNPSKAYTAPDLGFKAAGKWMQKVLSKLKGKKR